jgi:hypothetical protein
MPPETTAAAPLTNQKRAATERPKKEERAQMVKRIAGPAAVSVSAERQHTSSDKKCRRPAGATTEAVSDCPGRSLRLATSTRRPWCHKKSAPRMGKLTATRRKYQPRCTPTKETVKDFCPQQGIRHPSAPARLGPEGMDLDFHGMIEKAEPVSTKNQQLEVLSLT